MNKQFQLTELKAWGLNKSDIESAKQIAVANKGISILNTKTKWDARDYKYFELVSRFAKPLYSTVFPVYLSTGGDMNEYYTKDSDIDYVAKHFKDAFKDSIVVESCSNPYGLSKFGSYFLENFDYYQLKGVRISGFVENCENPPMLEYTKVNDKLVCRAVELYDHGDCVSEKNMDILYSGDKVIICTNPPYNSTSTTESECMADRVGSLLVKYAISHGLGYLVMFGKQNMPGLAKEFRSGDVKIVSNGYNGMEFYGSFKDERKTLALWYTNMSYESWNLGLQTSDIKYEVVNSKIGKVIRSKSTCFPGDVEVGDYVIADMSALIFNSYEDYGYQIVQPISNASLGVNEDLFDAVHRSWLPYYKCDGSEKANTVIYDYKGMKVKSKGQYDYLMKKVR